MPLMPGIITSSSTASTRCAPSISSASRSALGGQHRDSPCAPAGATARRGSSRRRRRAAAWRVSGPWSTVVVGSELRWPAAADPSCRAGPPKSIGFVSNSSQPASSARCRSPTIACAVSAMIGMCRVAVVGLEPARAFPAVELRQAEVHQDQIRRRASAPSPGRADRRSRAARRSRAGRAGATARRDSSRCLRRSGSAS